MEDNRVPSFVAVDPATVAMSSSLRSKRKRGTVEEPQKVQRPKRKMLRRRGQNATVTKEVEEIESLDVSEGKGLDAMELDMAVAVAAVVATKEEAGKDEPEVGDVSMVTKIQDVVEETKIAEEIVTAKNSEGEPVADGNKTDAAEKTETKTESHTDIAAANDDEEQPAKEDKITEAGATSVSNEAEEQQEDAATADAVEKDATDTGETAEEDPAPAAAETKEEKESKDSESEASTAVEIEEPKTERKSWLASAFGKVFSFW